MKSMNINFSRALCTALVLIAALALLALPALADQYQSVATGSWSATATWNKSTDGGATFGATATVPGNAATDTVLIQDTHTVTINQNFTIAKLTVGQGTSGTLIYDATAHTTTVSGDISVAVGGTYITQAATGATHTLSLGGNLTNNGTFDMSRGGSTLICNVTFTNTTGDQTITGTPTLTRFRIITLTKGVTSNRVVCSQNVSFAGAFALTTGTWEQTSGTMTCTSTSQTVAAGGAFVLSGSGSYNASGLASSWTISGTVTINTSGSFSTGSGNNSFVNSGTLNLTAGTVSIGGRLTLSAGTTTINGATILIDPQATNLLGATSNPFEISGTANVTFSSGSVTLVDPLAAPTNGRDFKVGSTVGTVNLSGGTVYFGDGVSTTTGSGGFTISNNTASPVPLPNIVLQTGGLAGRNVSLAGNTTIGGNLTLTSGTLADAGNTLTVNGNITNGTTMSGAGKVSLAGGAAQHTLAGTGTYGNLELNDAQGAQLSASPSVTGNLILTSGTFDPNGNTITGSGSTDTLKATTGTAKVTASTFAGNYVSFETVQLGSGSTVDYNSGSGQTVDNTLSYGNLTLTGSSTKLLAGATSVGGNLTVNTGADLRNTTGTGQNLTMSGAAATLQCDGTITGTNLGAGNDMNLVVSGAQTTVQGAGATCLFLNSTVNSGSKLVLARTLTTEFGAATVNGTLQINSGAFLDLQSATLTYGGSSGLIYNTGYNVSNEWGTGSATPQDVTFSSGTVNMPASTRTANGNVLINGGTLALSSTFGADLNVHGNWTRSSGSFTPNSRAVFFNGSSAQAINTTGGETFDYFVADNSAGVNLSSDVTAISGITLTNGIVGAGSSTLSLSGTGTTTRTNGYVNGNFKKTFASASSKDFEVGTANGYSPVTVNASSGGDMTVKASQGAHSPATPGNGIGRNWTLTNGGLTSADLTFNYLDPTDLSGVTEGNLGLWKYDGAWTKPAGGSVNTAANTASINGVTTFSDWSLAECPTITVLPASLPNGQNGTPYGSHGFSATGGTAPYTFSVTSGSLPTGLTLTGDTLSGTPTADGTYPFTITATDANGCTGATAYSITVTSCPVFSFTPASLANAPANSPVADTIVASGGTGPYTYTLSAGSLPTGLTLQTDGRITGTPTVPGSYSFTVLATDANLCTGTKAYTMVICGTISLSPGTLPDGVVGAAYSQTISASGGTPAYTFTVTAGSLPTGLTLASGGGLSGTPTATGPFSFTVTATDANGCSGSQAYSITINCPTITQSGLPNGTTGTPYLAIDTTTGGAAPYGYAVTSGTLPTGLTLSNDTLSGTPTAPGTFNFDITVTDANGCTNVHSYSIVISCGTISLSPLTLPNGGIGQSYNQTITASGGIGSYNFTVTSGSLPTGLSLSLGGNISGTAGAAGNFNFDVTATDANSCTGVRSYSITIASGFDTTIASGNWNAGTTWSTGAKPTGSQTAVVMHTVTLTASDTCSALIVKSGGVFDMATFTLGLAGSYTLEAGAEGRQSAFNTVPGRGATPWLFDAASTYTIQGTATGFGIGTATGITFGNVNWASSANATPPVGMVIQGNLVKSNTGQLRGGTGTTASRTVVVHGNVTVNGGTIYASNSTSPITGGFDIDGDLTIGASGTLGFNLFTGTGTIAVGGNFSNSGAIIRGAGTGIGTIYFKGTGTSNFDPGTNDSLKNVAIAPGRTIIISNNDPIMSSGSTFTDSGTVEFGLRAIKGIGNFNAVSGATLEIGSPDGVTLTGVGNVQVSGTRTYSAGANFTYDGSSAQFTGDGLGFNINNLTFDNAAGVTLTNATTVNGVLGLTNGNVNCGIYVLAVSATGSTNRTNGVVVGALKKNVSTGAGVSRTFEVGDASNYTPVTVTFGNVTGAGDIAAIVTNTEHPNVSTSGVDATKDVNRYFTLANLGASFDNYGAVFNFVPTDVDAGANTSNFIVKKYDSPNWTSTTTGTRTATSTQATGMTSMSDFAIGEAAPLAAETLTVNVVGNGSVLKNPNQTNFLDGDTVHLTANAGTGYHFFGWSGDASGNTNPLTVVMTSNKNITATFTIDTLIVTSGVVGGNGVIAPSGAVQVLYGADQIFTMTPNTGYHIDSVKVDGAYVGNTSPDTLKNVTANHTISVQFKINSYTIAATAGSGGSIVPSGTSSVNYGDSLVYTITADAGHHIDSVVADGGNLGAVSTYTFHNVTATHTIQAYFSINMYTLTINVNGNGSYLQIPPPAASYPFGTIIDINAQPSYSWDFINWMGDTNTTDPHLNFQIYRDMNIMLNFMPDSAYQVAFRSFSLDSITHDTDKKGKLGKLVPAKPWRVEFTAPFRADSNNVDVLHIEFGSSIDTANFPFTFDWPVTGMSSTDGRLKKWDVTFSPALTLAETVKVHGFAVATKIQKVSKYYWKKAGVATSKGKKDVVVTSNPRLPMPNRINGMFETFAQSGFPTGLQVGIARTDSVKKYGWLGCVKYTDAYKTLVDKTGQQSGTPRPIDVYTSNSKPILKLQKSLPPAKFNNKLLGDLVVLKLNIAASALGKTTLGFGELIYQNDVADIFNGMMLKQISAIADTMMSARTYAAQFPSKGQYDTLYGYAHLDSTVARINAAFEGKVDTTSFNVKIVFKGTRPLADVTFLRKAGPGVEPTVIAAHPNPIEQIPMAYTLYQNYPNPFNPTTKISFDLPTDAVVTLKVYNMLGQEVATLFNRESMIQGTQEVEFNGANFASGVYFYRIVAESFDDDGLSTGTFHSVMKMMLIK